MLMIRYLVVLLCLLGGAHLLCAQQQNNPRRDSAQIVVNSKPYADTLPINGQPLLLPSDFTSLYPPLSARSLRLSPIIDPFSSQYKSSLSTGTSLFKSPHDRRLPWETGAPTMNVPSHIPMDLSLYINTTPHSSTMPGNADYSAFRIGQLNNSPLNYLYGSSTQTWIGFTSVHTKSAGLFYRSDSEKFFTSVSGNIMQYGHMGIPQNNIGVNATAEYSITQWLIIGVYGNYSAYQNRNTSAAHIGFGPGSPFGSYGSYAQIFFYGDFGLQVDVGRRFDPMKRKWISTYGITPVIKRK